METEIEFKGIIPKTEEEKDLFVVKFDAKCGSWEDALKCKEVIENKLENILKGQKVLREDSNE